MEIGEPMLSIVAQNCVVDNNNILELKGKIFSPTPSDEYGLVSPIGGVILLKCVQDEKCMKLKVVDTFAISDDNGNFSVKSTINTKIYIVLKQKNNTGVVYSLSGFKK